MSLHFISKDTSTILKIVPSIVFGRATSIVSGTWHLTVNRGEVAIVSLLLRGVLPRVLVQGRVSQVQPGFNLASSLMTFSARCLRLSPWTDCLINPQL
jgi:hypothetical protein